MKCSYGSGGGGGSYISPQVDRHLRPRLDVGERGARRRDDLGPRRGEANDDAIRESRKVRVKKLVQLVGTPARASSRPR